MLLLHEGGGQKVPSFEKKEGEEFRRSRTKKKSGKPGKKVSTGGPRERTTKEVLRESKKGREITSLP